MSAPVDVLAVLRFIASSDWNGDAMPGNEAVDATVAAVAELIEKCEELVITPHGGAGSSLAAAIADVRAALARVGGAS